MSTSKQTLTVSGSLALAALLVADLRAQGLVERLVGTYESEFGESVAVAGDIDGDGVGDLLVGAPGNGEVFLHSGATLQPIWSAGGGYLFGSAVLGDVDLDGDGKPEVIASKPMDKGFVRIFGSVHGSEPRHIPAPKTKEYFGASLCHGGDIDGDGTPEIVIGSPAMFPSTAEPGRIYYYSYAKDAFVRVLVLLDPVEWGLGETLADAGDVDGDGKTDLAATYRTLAGAEYGVRIYSGMTGVALRDLLPPEGAMEFGKSIVAIGPKVPGGPARIAVGAPAEFAEGGQVYLFDATTGEVLERMEGAPGSRFGHSLAASKSIAPGGSQVLLVGAPAIKWGVTIPGRVYVYDGGTSTLLHELTSVVQGEGFGHSLAWLGDLVGDAEPEFAIGAPRWNGWSGAVYVHEGVTPCGAAKNLGGGCFGSFGIQPNLAIDGCLRASAETALDVEISGGPHFPTFGLLFLGAFDGSLKLNPQCSLQFAQIFGSPILLPITPNGSMFPLSMGSGKFTASATLPATGYAYSFRAQMVIADVGVPYGFSTTNGLELAFKP